jgi:homoserine O-succinyltransferase
LEALRDHGYSIVSASPDSGADMFTKQSSSLLVFFQGHPEYESTTLLREYRRDVGRFLRGQQTHYPTLPEGYFPPEALDLLRAFETRARAGRDAELLNEFPSSALADTLQNTWSDAAIGIYRNWLALLARQRKSASERKNQRNAS